MQMWVDADACPKVIKEIIYRAAQRTQMMTYFVANQSMYLPTSPYLRSMQVESGFDSADNYIIEKAQKNDLIITADIPLAAKVVEKGAVALNPRGEFYSQHNIGEILKLRDFMTTLRESGIETGGPSSLRQNDRQAFANQLDRLLTHYQLIRPSIDHS